MIIVFCIYTLIVILMCAVCTIIVHKLITDKKQTPEEFVSLLSILSSLIKTELDAYDQDIFENKGSITNNNFDRYYHDLTQRVLQNISPKLISDLSYYYTEDAIYKFIGRTIRDYLVTKINGTV